MILAGTRHVAHMHDDGDAQLALKRDGHSIALDDLQQGEVGAHRLRRESARQVLEDLVNDEAL